MPDGDSRADGGFNDAVGDLRTWSRQRRSRKRQANRPGGFNDAVGDLKTGR